MPQSHSDDTVYTRATNTKGFSSTVRVSYPPDITEAISALVATGSSPYKTNADFHRDASQHRLLYWQGQINDPNFVRKVTIAERLANAESRTNQIMFEERLLETRRVQLSTISRDAAAVRDTLLEIDDDLAMVTLSYVRDGLIALVDQYNHK